tara:strand:+ start:32 stop:547 length:516 start_codon:yes stop_codon:yes gene_type:complete
MSTLKVDKITPVGGLGSGAVGGIIQVVSTTKTDVFSSSSTDTNITGLSVTITPQSSSSKILVFMSITGTNQNTNQRFAFGLKRGSTQIAQGDAADSRTRASVGGQDGGGGNCDSCVVVHLDSPSTTSATTYQATSMAIDGGTNTVNRTNSDSNGSSYARFASFITAFEIGG